MGLDTIRHCLRKSIRKSFTPQLQLIKCPTRISSIDGCLFWKRCFLHTDQRRAFHRSSPIHTQCQPDAIQSSLMRGLQLVQLVHLSLRSDSSRFPDASTPDLRVLSTGPRTGSFCVPTISAQLRLLQRKCPRPDSPLCPLLVEHTTAAVLAPDRVGLPQVSRGAAVTAQVLHLGIIVAEVRVEGAGLSGQGSAAEAAAWGAGRDGVAFARHFGG